MRVIDLPILLIFASVVIALGTSSHSREAQTQAFAIADSTVASDEAKATVEKPQKKPKLEFFNRHLRQGSVTAITKDSITVQCPELEHRTQRLDADGVKRWHTIILPETEPRAFAVSEVLASGGIPREPRVAYRVSEYDMYRLKDVKVGDWVYLVYSRVDGVDICDHINIVKRPGGRVPPLPEGVEEPSFIPYHERMNAYWDLQDKGIPYPEHFKHMRRWPIAPPPRAVIRK